MRQIGAMLLCWLCAPVLLSAQLPDHISEFDIRAQPLSSALLQFSGQSGIQVLAADRQIADRYVHGVHGRLAAATALNQLLSGTGLAFRRVGEQTFVLTRADEAGAARADSPEATAEPSSRPPAVLQEVEEIQITGTRIRGPGINTAAAPMTSITGEDLRRLGIVNVADALTTLVPQNHSTFQPALVGDDYGGTLDRGALFVGNTIVNLRGLDPEFGSRTLTLIDGRRVVSTSNQADIVDLNIIPSILLDRMDVVTGGASATYGSGAMAGVINLVLNRRLTGLHLDLDYGITEAGDGRSPHVSLAGGLPVSGGRGHVLAGFEWQDQAAIRDCAAARDWCAAARTLFTNFSGTGEDVAAPLVALPGFEGYPARFEMDDVRYSQYAPSGAIYSSSESDTFGYRFTDDGTGFEQYSYGYRGGTGRNTVNGDGPLVTSGVPLRPSTERRSAFANFEYDFTPAIEGYLQTVYATTDSRNWNRAVQSIACVRFNTQGVDAVVGGTAMAGDVVTYGGNGEAFTDPFNGGAPVPDIVRNALWSNPNFRVFLGNLPSGRVPPYFIRPGQSGSTDTTPPVWTFANVTNPVWQRITSAQGTAYWNLVSVTLTADFADPGAPAVLPKPGRNAYAFLGNLQPDALDVVQRAFGNSSTAGGGNSALTALYGGTPCRGFTAVRKVWNPQLTQWTRQVSDTWRAVAGLRGRFGGDWRWEAYYQYGATGSTSTQNNVQTNLSFAFAMDAVLDDRVGSSTYGQPVCRILRDGIPVLDSSGRPLSDPAGLAKLATGCKPLNIFGTAFSDPAAAGLQREALDYAFKKNISDGANSLQTLSLTSSGTLWEGWAGPLAGAFGLELRDNTVDNQGSRGPFYERADLSQVWGDAFGGRTRVAEGYAELNMPLVRGRQGINWWSANAALRYGIYNNKGGAGTTGASATQDTPNWKFQTEFAPFEWVRFRVTRSRDLRAADYRDLFLNQPGIPDQASGVNPWRERTAASDENQRERWGFIRVGNPQLNPEKSDTLTMGLVLRPRGPAQGLNFSADYYQIRVKGAIYTPYDFSNPIQACWENSGNRPATYIDGEVDPANRGVNGLFDPERAECREIMFGTNEDGSRNLDDIVSYNATRPVNSLPYERRGIDLALDYMFPLRRLFPDLPGSVSLMLRGTRALEASGIQRSCAGFTIIDNTFQCVEALTRVDLVGQVRSSVFVPGVSASPRWKGNVMATYLNGNLAASLSARYVGGAKLDNTWSDDPADPAYQDAAGQLLNGSVDRNRVDPYLNFALNLSYDLRVAHAGQFQMFASVNNLFNKSPPFTGGGISGASAQYYDTLGRAYRMGVRLRF
jgi:outer membrane receptor protein involved in Fe transport